MRKEHEIGSLEKGKAADMVVLDRNLFEIDPGSIVDTRVCVHNLRREGRLRRERRNRNIAPARTGCPAPRKGDAREREMR